MASSRMRERMTADTSLVSQPLEPGDVHQLADGTSLDAQPADDARSPAAIDRRRLIVSGLTWGVMFQALEVVVSFGAMLVLVRILSPVDYGRAAATTGVVAMLGIFNAHLFISHALQLPDNETPNWSQHWRIRVLYTDRAVGGMSRDRRCLLAHPGIYADCEAAACRGVRHPLRCGESSRRNDAAARSAASANQDHFLGRHPRSHRIDRRPWPRGRSRVRDRSRQQRIRRDAIRDRPVHHPRLAARCRVVAFAGLANVPRRADVRRAADRRRDDERRP